MDATIEQRIKDDVTNNKVMLYIKGTPVSPECGFSAQVISVLDSYEIEYKTFNILEDEDIRSGIKEYADWPTTPQLYINGEFIGGCDIVTELHSTGELKKLIDKI